MPPPLRCSDVWILAMTLVRWTQLNKARCTNLRFTRHGPCQWYYKLDARSPILRENFCWVGGWAAMIYYDLLYDGTSMDTVRYGQKSRTYAVEVFEIFGEANRATLASFQSWMIPLSVYYGGTRRTRNSCCNGQIHAASKVYGCNAKW